MSLTRRLQIKKDMTLEIDVLKHKSSNISITVMAGRNLNLVWVGKSLDRIVNPSIQLVLHKHARLHMGMAVYRSNNATIKTSVELVGSGAEAYISAVFHGIGKDRHAFDVSMHHQAKNTKGDILIKGVYEDSAFGQFNGLLKIHPNADLTNSYFADNVLLFGQGMATSIPTLEILANDVRATHGSTTSRVNAEQIFYLMSRGLSRRQAVRNLINGFFHPVLARIPGHSAKIFPHVL